MPLAHINLSTTSMTELYVVPASKRLVGTVSLCNRNAASVKLSLALTTGGAPATTDYIEFETNVGPNVPLERTALVLSAGEKIYAQTDAAGVSAVVFGIVEDA